MSLSHVNGVGAPWTVAPPPPPPAPNEVIDVPDSPAETPEDPSDRTAPDMRLLDAMSEGLGLSKLSKPNENKKNKRKHEIREGHKSVRELERADNGM